MTLTLDTPGIASPLAGRRMPRWSPVAAAAAAVAVALGLFALTPLSGHAEFVLVTVLLYLVGLAAASAAVEGRRRAIDRIMTNLLLASVLLAVLPLVAVLGTVLARGLARFDATFLTHSMRAVAEQDPGGGAYHAIVGTLEQVGLASAIAVPFGLLVAIYLVEYARGRLGRAVSFFVDVMTGLPSIVAGLFVLALWILVLGQPFSGFAGSLALVILMLPIVVRSAEEIITLVPDALREASYALGVPTWVTVLRIVLPTALPGILTGVMLAVARVTGETAPVLLVVFGNPSININPFSGSQESLPLFVFSEAGLPDATAIDRAWAGALALILIVAVLNVLARVAARFARISG